MSSSATPVVARRTTTSTTSPAPVNGTLPRRQPSTTSLRSIASARTTAAAPPLRRPASSTSLASRRSASTTTLGPSARRPSASSTTGASTGAATVRPTARTRSSLPAAAGASRRTPAAAAAAAAARAAAASPSPGLPGTSLLAGIPCIVTVRTGAGGQGGKALRIKAQVRYIGALVDEEGQWVGVEALESAIPPEAANLSWCEGRRGDGASFSPSRAPPCAHADLSSSRAVTYFSLTPASSASSSEPPTRPTSPALRPPSRRAPRRSASPTGQRERGPRKALFVRPDQVRPSFPSRLSPLSRPSLTRRARRADSLCALDATSMASRRYPVPLALLFPSLPREQHCPSFLAIFVVSCTTCPCALEKGALATSESESQGRPLSSCRKRPRRRRERSLARRRIRSLTTTTAAERSSTTMVFQFTEACVHCPPCSSTAPWLAAHPPPLVPPRLDPAQPLTLADPALLSCAGCGDRSHTMPPSRRRASRCARWSSSVRASGPWSPSPRRPTSAVQPR